MSRHKYEVSDRDRAVVKSMASYGVPQEEIGAVIGCSHVTLRRYFAAELKTAAIQANAKVAETCYTMAISGQHPAATFFWLKTRARWRETTDHRFVNEEGKDRDVHLTVRYIRKPVPHDDASADRD